MVLLFVVVGVVQVLLLILAPGYDRGHTHIHGHVLFIFLFFFLASSISVLSTSSQSVLRMLFGYNSSQQAYSLSGNVLFVCLERLFNHISRSAHAVSFTSVL